MAEDLNAECQAYEQAIYDVGGIGLQLLGIGETGHIGFNEPPSPFDSRTRKVALHAARMQACLVGTLTEFLKKYS